MNNPNQRPSNPAPMRYSSRQKIFANQPQIQRGGDQQELFRIVAKIRSLQDDVRTLLTKNRQIQTDNKYLARLMSELQYAISVQQNQIQNLTQRIRQEQRAAQSINSYELTLTEVGQKVTTLNQLNLQRNWQYEQLRGQKDQVLYQRMRLKEQNNGLQFEYNRLMQEVDGMTQLLGGGEVEEELEQRVQAVVAECRFLEQSLRLRQRGTEGWREEGAGLLLVEREKQMRSQYNIKLLAERVRDGEQRKNYFAGCYNQGNIQAQIDDMLEKQHTLRKQAAEQLQANQALQKEGEEAVTTTEKRIVRERAAFLEQIKLQQMENSLQIRKKEKAQADLGKLASSTSDNDDIAVLSSQWVDKDQEPYRRIRQLQSQNGLLQGELIRLQEEVEMLRLELQV